MTGLLIAATIITGFMWAALRLHAGWAPPPPPPPPPAPTPLQQYVAHLTAEVHRVGRAIGEALIPTFVAFGDAVRQLEANLREHNR